jgi:PPP family 3-phenylpropionic acid transporter
MSESAKIKLIYFLVYSGLAIWISYFNVHLEKEGFSGFEIGVANAVYVSAAIIVIPVGGILSDRYGRYRVLFILTMVSGLLIFFLGYANSYVLILLLMFGLSLFNQPVNAVIDGVTLHLLEKEDRHAYGKYMLWGSFGFSVGVLGVGSLAVMGSQALFIVSAIMIWAAGIIVGFNVFKYRKKEEKPVNLRSLVLFYNNARLRKVFILILLFGIAVSPLHYFINLYFTSIGASAHQIGLAFAIQAFFEIPLFFLGIWYMKKVGPERIIIIAMLVTVLMMVFYGLTYEPWLAVSIGLLHGFTISFFLIGVVEFVQRQTPAHLRTTAQALILSFHFGAGLALGSLDWVPERPGRYASGYVDTVRNCGNYCFYCSFVF